MHAHPARGRLLPSLIGTVGIALWATETVLITFTTGIPPLQTVGLAFAFAALLSPLVWLVTGDDPLAAFRQPRKVWLVTVVSLVGYHACIYYATQKAPPAAAALLQGTTPLIIVLGSAFLPGERLRWWHVAGSALGFAGILMLIETGGEEASGWVDAGFYLAIVGVAAGLWGLYSVASRSFGAMPSSALGVFYAASALVSLVLHVGLETFVMPTEGEWLAIAALGVLPMGLALYFWDFGVKHGDIQALGAISYVEPFIGAALVALIGQGSLTVSLMMAGVLVVAGAGLASCGLFRTEVPQAARSPGPSVPGARPEGNDAEALSRLEDRLLTLSLDILHRAGEHPQAGSSARHAPADPELDALTREALAAWSLVEKHKAAGAR